MNSSGKQSKRIAIISAILLATFIIGLVGGYFAFFFIRRGGSLETFTSDSIEPPLIPPIFQRLKEKIFDSPDPLEFSPEELVGLEQLKALEDKNPILQNNRYFRIIKELYADLVLVIEAYKENKYGFDVASLTQEQTKALENLFRKSVTCFKDVRESLEKMQASGPKGSLNKLTSPELGLRDEGAVTSILPKTGT